MANPSEFNSVGAFWDHLYAPDVYRYGLEPNEFFAEHTGAMPSGMKALLPGDGEGRNGVWLARQGHDVTIVDASARGLDKARTLAEHYRVNPTFVHADLTVWEPEPDTFDLVGALYVHIKSALRAGVHTKYAAALKPGGTLLIEAFSLAQMTYGSGGPGNPDLLFSIDQLREDFDGLIIEKLDEEEVILDHGTAHEGEGVVIRLIAKKAL